KAGDPHTVGDHACDLRIQLAAVDAGEEGLQGATRTREQHTDARGSHIQRTEPTMPASRAAIRGAATSAASSISSIEVGSWLSVLTRCSTPTRARTWKPECTAARTSGTIDMPTRSAPAIFR